LPPLGSRSDLLERAFALPGGQTVQALAGPGLYLVGGTVRDLLLGRPPKELDLVVERPLRDLLTRLEGTKVVYGSFETATVLTADGAAIDIARSRRERYPHPGALPEVEPAGLEEDLWRRDFTVNALALATGGPQAGTLYGLPTSLADLEARRLEVIHPRSFRDDPTRLVRLARYHARLSFALGAQTAAWAAAAVATGALKTVSCQRIVNDLRRNLGEEDPLGQLQALERLGLLRGLGLARPSQGAVAGALALAGGEGDRLLLLGVALLAGSPRAARGLEFLYRCGLERPLIRGIAVSLRAYPALVELFSNRAPFAAIHRASRGVPVEGIAWAAACAGPLGLRHGAAYLRRRAEATVAISGKDLLAAGASPGPALGRALAAVEEQIVEGRLGLSRGEQLKAALALLEVGGDG
jgi:tRNA nucleotidyltransferase (CCA-adding enzyme)